MSQKESQKNNAKKVGRPKVPNKRTITVHMAVTDEVDARLRKFAEKENRPIAQMARIIFEKAILDYSPRQSDG